MSTSTKDSDAVSSAELAPSSARVSDTANVVHVRSATSAAAFDAAMSSEDRAAMLEEEEQRRLSKQQRAKNVAVKAGRGCCWVLHAILVTVPWWTLANVLAGGAATATLVSTMVRLSDLIEERTDKDLRDLDVITSVFSALIFFSQTASVIMVIASTASSGKLRRFCFGGHAGKRAACAKALVGQTAMLVIFVIMYLASVFSLLVLIVGFATVALAAGLHVACDGVEQGVAGLQLLLGFDEESLSKEDLEKLCGDIDEVTDLSLTAAGMSLLLVLVYINLVVVAEGNRRQIGGERRLVRGKHKAFKAGVAFARSPEGMAEHEEARVDVEMEVCKPAIEI